MTEPESRKLKVGDAVVFSDGVRGVVEQVGYVGVECRWEDGQQGVIHHDDMQDVERRAVPTTLHGMADIHARQI